jgi:putative transposase
VLGVWDNYISSCRSFWLVPMRYDSKKYHRRSIRLKGFDYTKSGPYFISITTQNRNCLFGNISDGQLHLSDAGLMIQRIWYEIPANYPGIETDAIIVMPNHIHGIILCDRGRPLCLPGIIGINEGQPQGVAPTHLSLPDIVHRFKTLTTKQYTDGVKRYHWPAFQGRLWQRNYYEHIIRNERALERIRYYIQENPANWLFDRENPDTQSRAPEDTSIQGEEPWRV